METRMMMSVSQEGSHGAANAGGIHQHTFAKDGGISLLDRRPTSVCASSVQLARPLQICWHSHLPFHSSSITSVKTTSLQKMKRQYFLLSSSVIASAAFALLCLIQICRSSPWPSMR